MIGEVAVVTGAGSGIGASLARHAAALGMHVALCDVDATSIDRLAGELSSSHVEAVAFHVDVSDANSVEELASQVFERWGHTRLLFNNAGIDAHGRLWEFSTEQWNSSVGVNLDAVFHGVRSFVPRMLESARRGHIINVSSVAAFAIRPYMAPYMATKHACLALTECLYHELKQATDLVTASVVIPGAVDTSIFRSGTSADIDGPGEKQRLELMSGLVEQGIDPAAAAEIIFAGVARNDLWIHTHPEASDARITSRAEALLSRTAQSAG